jgi:hypothetical protein
VGPLRRGCGARGGSVIIIVLVTLMFTSVALTLFIEKASNDLLVEARAADDARLRREASSALETVLAVLQDFQDVNGGLRSPQEGWDDPLGFAGYEPEAGRTVEVNFEDESGRISLPSATGPVLVNVFKGWGLSPPNADKLSDAILGWMKKDYVGTSAGAPRAEDYDRGELPFIPPSRPLRSFDELASIDYARDLFYDENGNPTELWRRFVATFSLYEYNSPNINGAAPDLLSAYGSTDPNLQKRLDDYIHGRGSYKNRGPGFFPDKERVAFILGAQSPAAELGTEIRALRVHVTVREGQSSYRLSVLVAPTTRGGARIPRAAASNTDGDGASPPAASPQPTPSAGGSSSGRTTIGGSGATAEKKLNYPFTLLEIRENDAISSTPAES